MVLIAVLKLLLTLVPQTDATPLSYTAPSSPNPPRGPPRKPKQSGHALWVGNLPPGASVIDLKDHFSQDATDDIESVFLISKSNCAFVNYRSALACADALARFHDSRFHGVRLVCRLRKGFTAPGSGSGSASMGLSGLGSRLRTEETLDPPSSGEAINTDPETGPGPTHPTQDGNARSIDRYFIVKSLTVDDLELSKQSGIWATQTHNETSLNQAFEVSIRFDYNPSSAPGLIFFFLYSNRLILTRFFLSSSPRLQSTST
jgi:RNA recognition motif-containing protein